MEIILYPGDSQSHLDYFTEFLTLQNTRFDISSSTFGHKLVVYGDTEIAELLASHICRFIVDFYIKEAVISKIYDEYPFFNTEDASMILSNLSAGISSSPIKDDILKIIVDKKSINSESYVVFNIKSIMLCAYSIIDDIAAEIEFNTQKEHLLSVIRMFSKLSFNGCNSADVEFSSYNECRVSLDNNSPVTLPGSDLLAYLVQTSPRNVCITNPELSPELSSIVCEIFDSETKNK